MSWPVFRRIPTFCHVCCILTSTGQCRFRSLSWRLNIWLGLTQTSLFVERMNQYPLLSCVIDISPHVLMAVSLEEKEGENRIKKKLIYTWGWGEKEREGKREGERDFLSGIGQRKPWERKRLGEAHRIWKPVFQPLTLLLYKHFEIVMPGTDKNHQGFWFADNHCTNKFHAGITIYSKRWSRAGMAPVLENFIKDVDYLGAKG